MSYKPLESGRLRHHVEIEQLVVTQDPESGDITNQWVLYAKRWAEYTASSVKDFIAASASQSQVTGRFVVRADEGLDATMRIAHRGKHFAVLGVLPDPDSGYEYMTLPVSEGVRIV